MKLGSLFSGSGTCELAGVLCGIEPVWASEVEKFPIQVTSKRFPNMKHLGDITKINGAEIEPVDIITGGFPCQSVSQAGKREGLKLEDGSLTRSGLVYEAFRVIREMKEASNNEYPKYLLFENVPGLLSSSKGEDFKAIMNEIANLGYIADVNMLDAQDFHVPQRRKRIFISCANVDYLMENGNMLLSESVCLQLKAELLFNVLAITLNKLQIKPNGLGVNIPLRNDESLKRTIDLFALKQESRIQQLINIIIQVKTKISNKQIIVDSSLLVRCIYDAINEALSCAGNEISNDDLTEATSLAISCYFNAVLSAMEDAAQYLSHLEQTKQPYHHYFYWVQSYLTEMREYINASIKYIKKHKHMGRDDDLRLIDAEIRSLESEVERHFGNERPGEILSISESLLRHPAPGDEAREGIPGDTQTSADGASGYGETGIGYWQDGIQCLRAEGENRPSRPSNVVVSAGFNGHKSVTGSIQYQEEAAPTLESNMPSNVIINSETEYLTPWDTQSHRIFTDHGIAPTLSGADGGGGRNPAGIVFPINTQIATRHNALGERTGLGIGKETDPAFTLQEAHGHAVAVIYPEDTVSTLVARADGSPCIDRGQPFVVTAAPFDTTQITSPQNASSMEYGSPCHTISASAHAPAAVVVIGAFMAGQGAKAGSIAYQEEVSPTLKSVSSGGNTVPSIVTYFEADTNHTDNIAFSFDSLASNSMKSSNPNSGCRQVDVARTIDTSTQDPSKNQGGIAIVTYPEITGTLCASGAGLSRPAGQCNEMDLCIVQENTAVLGSGQQVVGTLRASHATKQWLGNQEAFNGDYHIVENSEPSLLGIDCENTPENADTVYCIQGNTIDRSDTAGANGKGVNENISFSLNTIDRHVVATASGIDCRNGTESKELSATLQAHKDGGYSLNATHPVRINQSVRRLTPTECARLQGMPDWWLSDIPHSDSAAYKIWGNGMAAPCVLYIMRNIVETINQEENNGKENI